MVIIFNCYRGFFQYTVLDTARVIVVVVWVGGEEDHATGRVGEGLAGQACRGIPLVTFNLYRIRKRPTERSTYIILKPVFFSMKTGNFPEKVESIQIDELLKIYLQKNIKYITSDHFCERVYFNREAMIGFHHRSIANKI